MKKLFACFIAVCAAAAFMLGSVFADEINTIPTPINFYTHAGFMPYVQISETEPGVNKYVLSSTGQNHTPMVFSYDKELIVPLGGFKDDLISFTFKSSLPEGKTFHNDFFFNFGFRLQQPSLPSWNQVFGVYLTFYSPFDTTSGRAMLMINDGAPVSPDETDELKQAAVKKISDLNYLDGNEHTVEIYIDSEEYIIEIYLDKGTENEKHILFQSDNIFDTPDQFDPTGGYCFMAHNSITEITNFKAINTKEAPSEPEPEVSPSPSAPAQQPTPKPDDKDESKGGCSCSSIIASSLMINSGIILFATVAAVKLFARKRGRD